MADDFSARYRLLKCIAVDGGIRTHSAQELATSRIVMVHLVDNAGPDEVEQLRAQLSRLTVPEKNRVLETATIASGFAIVTDFMPGMGPFSTWVRANSGVDTPPVESAPKSRSNSREFRVVKPPVLDAPVTAQPATIVPADVPPIPAPPQRSRCLSRTSAPWRTPST